MSTSEIGKRLFWAREQANLTVRALGKMANVSPSTVTEIENSHHVPRADMIEKLAAALKVERCWLAYGDGKPPKGWREER